MPPKRDSKGARGAVVALLSHRVPAREPPAEPKQPRTSCLASALGRLASALGRLPVFLGQETSSFDGASETWRPYSNVVTRGSAWWSVVSERGRASEPEAIDPCAFRTREATWRTCAAFMAHSFSSSFSVLSSREMAFSRISFKYEGYPSTAFSKSSNVMKKTMQSISARAVAVRLSMRGLGWA